MINQKNMNNIQWLPKAIIGVVIHKTFLFNFLLSIRVFLEIARISTMTMPVGHKTVSAISWWYHDNTGIVLARIVDVLSMSVLGIVWYFLHNKFKKFFLSGDTTRLH